MKIKATVTTTREVERDITLPYFAKDKYGTKFYRINEDGSILSVSIVTGHKEGIVYANMELEKKAKESTISNLITTEVPCGEEEFEQAICSVVEYMDEQVKQFA